MLFFKQETVTNIHRIPTHRPISKASALLDMSRLSALRGDVLLSTQHAHLGSGPRNGDWSEHVPRSPGAPPWPGSPAARRPTILAKRDENRGRKMTACPWCWSSSGLQ